MTPLRLDQLTFTRFVAAMTVVMFHFGHGVFPFDVAPIDRIVFGEPIAVSYFFVLSGFVMASVYYRPGEPFDKAQYWNARFARIYPVYALALAIPVIATLRAGAESAAAIGLSALLLQAWVPPYPLTLNAPGWTLSVEAFFYLLFPFLVVKASAWSDRKLIVASIALWAVTQLAHFYLLNHHYGGYPSRSHDFIFYNPLFHVSTFVTGTTAGILLVRHRPRSPLTGFAATSIWMSACALVVTAVAFEGTLSEMIGFRAMLNNGALAPVFAVLIVALALDDGPVSRLLRRRSLVVLGEASYAVYLLQVPLRSIYEGVVGPGVRAAPGVHFYLYALLLVGVSVAVFHWIERPARAKIRAWYDARCERTIAAAARR